MSARAAAVRWTLALALAAPMIQPGPAAAAEPLNTVSEVFGAFYACWTPPPPESAQSGTEITVRFSFNRWGKIVGQPLITFVTPHVSAELKAAYRRAVADTLARCSPLHFTSGLGHALAGHPLSVRFIDDRKLQ